MGPNSTPRAQVLVSLATAALLLLASGCATTNGSFEAGWFTRTVKLEGPAGRTSQTLLYRTGTAQVGWGVGQAPPGDFAYYNANLGATVYADSSCGTKYDDSPLTVLSNHLTMGFADVEQVDQSAGELSGRGSLERISRANLDGVPVMLATTVVKKDICVFDLILIARPDSFEEALADYRSLRDGFEARFER
jgi:hypothetical protein